MAIGLGWAALAFGTVQAARAQDAPSGRYRALPSKIEASVTAWGEDCGPKPKNHRVPGADSVAVETTGAHLRIVFPDRTLLTNGCWTPNRAVKLVGATAADDGYRAECRTPAHEPKREHGVYLVRVLADGRLELVEESQYDWQLKQSRCKATVRIAQTLIPEHRESTHAEPTPKAGCVPGAPVRLRLRPSHAQIEPGRRLCFSLRAFDEKGCRIHDWGGTPPSLELEKPPGTQASLTKQCFRAADSAALGEGTFEVIASLGRLRDTATIVVATADLSDITLSRSHGGAAPARAPEIPLPGDHPPSDLGVRSVVPGSSNPAVLAAAVALLGLVVLLVSIRRQRRPTAAVSEGGRAVSAGTHEAGTAGPSLDQQGPEKVASAEPISPAAQAPRMPGSGRDQPLICPTCRRGHAPGSLRCLLDGTPLVAYAQFAQRADEDAARPRSCGQCGAPTTTDASFCGVCGARLEPS